MNLVTPIAKPNLTVWLSREVTTAVDGGGGCFYETGYGTLVTGKQNQDNLGRSSSQHSSGAAQAAEVYDPFVILNPREITAV